MVQCHTLRLSSMNIRKRQRYVAVTVDGYRHQGILTEFQVVEGRKIVARFETMEAAQRYLKAREQSQASEHSRDPSLGSPR
jgi:hypothetical protein